MSAKKQGTLFSFFSKKASPDTGKKSFSSKSKVSKFSDLASSTSKESKIKTKLDEEIKRVKVGSRLSVYWPDDKKFYASKVTSIRNGGSLVTLLYDDGEVETVDLSVERFKILSEINATETQGSPIPRENQPETTSLERVKKKRRIIQDDSEDDFEEETGDGDEDDSQVSEFIADDLLEDEELDGSFIITDEDEEDIGRRKNNKRARESKVKNPYEKADKKIVTLQTPRPTSAVFVTPPPSKPSSLCSNSFNSYKLKKRLDDSQNNSDKTKPSTSELRLLRSLKPALKSKSSDAPTSNLPIPIEKTVNPAGSHYHNHFTFLSDEKRRDGKNRPMSHPEYDPRTLKVDFDEIRSVTKSKITPASEQWWKIKSQYADTILLFKTGKFYEIFHMDADIAVEVLGFSYMKGTIAHAGFPEVGYGGFCEKLVQSGYKVARVEQTETPEMLKERKKQTSGKKPQVVNREVCSIVSAGTRTFCYMDDTSGLERETYDGSIGPLLAIKEVLHSDMEDEGDALKPACEFGITIIDAATGTISLGQFADDVLYSRMNTLLTKFRPSEILVQKGSSGASERLHSLLKATKDSLLPHCRVELIGNSETFPKSTAIRSDIRAKINRPTSQIQPWDKEETLKELYRKSYFPRATRKNLSCDDIVKGDGISRWPKTLQACIIGGANLALSSLGAVLFYLQRSLIDEEILSMGIIKPYIPPEPTKLSEANSLDTNIELKQIANQEESDENGVDVTPIPSQSLQFDFSSRQMDNEQLEKENNYLSLDGTTIANLEILSSIHSHTSAGSLWSKINYTKTPFGARLLRAWLLRPLFKKTDIDRRADAVEELMSGGVGAAMSEAREVLAKCGDLERLLSRVHSMGGNGNSHDGQHHPNERAVLYETAKHTKRKVEDFSRLLNGLRAAARVADIFSDVDVQSGMLQKILKTTDNGGCIHPNIVENLDWFFDNFDTHAASKGLFEPTKGIDENYDAAVDEVERIKKELEDYQFSICSEVLKPSHAAKRDWKYINTKPDSKDKYLIELPVNVEVPDEFIVKGKRGKGHKQINKYRTFFVEQRVEELERALETMKLGKERGMQMVFSKFDSMRSLWASLTQATAMLDALAALSEASSRSGFNRPQICDCSQSDSPHIDVKQGRHPCVDFTHNGGNFIPNDLKLGGDTKGVEGSRILLLSGPNMGGKSTLLRQTCLIAILAQIGCFVPAEECTLTPFDRIFTRLGASDRILMGQSTFFVELAETAAALRGASRRSLVIMDELGRGTSTFDGTAIASASVKHLVERSKCLTLFATHYHSLLEDWKNQPSVRLGHMECVVEDDSIHSSDDGDRAKASDGKITFLYTLGQGICPKSFGINVARLAAIPEEILAKAREVSSSFESAMNDKSLQGSARSSAVMALSDSLQMAVQEEKWDLIDSLWDQLNSDDAI